MAWAIKEVTEDSGVLEFSPIYSYDWNFQHSYVDLFKFRVLDDDGIIYAYGVSTDCDSEEAFEPLDEWAMPSLGATEIQYYLSGTWETL